MRKGLSKDLIARVLGARPKYTVKGLEEMFPLRNLPQGAMVTRVAPSPTGFMHLGNFYQYLINYKLAKQTGGIFYLRVEDTDTKREVTGAVDVIFKTVKNFDMLPDEGPEQGLSPEALAKGGGNYGPYYQSERKDIYHSVVAQLLEDGRAYPCFLTSEEMDEIREKQKAAGWPTGIYGEWARDRDLTQDEIIARLDAGEVPSIRLYSTADRTQKIFCKDIVRGSIAFPQNDEDVVLIKSGDGLPTYHFAHVVDDHFMRTTNVVRGEEWLPSLPLHIQLFNIMGWTAPAYIHTSTLDTIDVETGNQRKLSKRKDPQANMEFFFEQGWPTYALLEYLVNIISSGYEEAKAKGQVKSVWDYEIRPKKIPQSSALFDMKKLEWWAREFIATLPTTKLLDEVLCWAGEYSPDWYERIQADTGYVYEILDIERDNPKRIRKDFVTWKQTLEEVAYFFDDLFVPNTKFDFNRKALTEFLLVFDEFDEKDIWWGKVVEIAEMFGLKNGDVAMNLRAALTGRTNTPDLHSIIRVMGGDKVRARIKSLI